MRAFVCFYFVSLLNCPHERMRCQHEIFSFVAVTRRP
jgi:hypothetical protein